MDSQNTPLNRAQPAACECDSSGRGLYRKKEGMASFADSPDIFVRTCFLVLTCRRVVTWIRFSHIIAPWLHLLIFCYRTPGDTRLYGSLYFLSFFLLSEKRGMHTLRKRGSFRLITLFIYLFIYSSFLPPFLAAFLSPYPYCLMRKIFCLLNDFLHNFILATDDCPT